METNDKDKHLSPAKKALLEKWLKGPPNDRAANIPRRPSGIPAGISFPQQRQLFLELLNRGTAVNNLSVLLELKGALDTGALEESANMIVARHETLRTGFAFENGILSPRILQDLRISLPMVDLRGDDESAQMSLAREQAEKEVLIPFDLARAPLIRLRLYALNEKHHVLLVVTHHTISDGWSLGVFLKELTILYGQLLAGNSAPLPELPVQYADYAWWQNNEKWLRDLPSSMDYWKKQLGGELPVLDLPTDHPRSTKQTYSGGTYRFVISREMTEALEKLARESDATLFMTLLTAFYILLGRYGGQEEVIVGSPMANRSHPDLENMIGVFINPVALKADLSGNPGFRELLARVRKVCLEAYAHQDLPFEKLVEELNPQRDLSRTPIFQVIFNMQNSPMPELGIPGLSMRFLDIDRGVSQFDLTLMLTRQEGKWQATVEYGDDLFEEESIARLFRSYLLLLEDIILNPGKPVSSLRLISSQEKDRLIHELNQSGMGFPEDSCLHRLFEAQAESSPEAIAIVFEGGSLSYALLNQRADSLAQYLQTLGVARGVRVGILMERSMEIVVALLAVHKAGGTYVPMHLSIPEERVEYICRDAALKVLITNTVLTAIHTLNITIVNLNEGGIPAGGAPAPQPAVTSRDLAYIMYTSGSTGLPKGVMVTHASLVNFLWSMRQRPGIKKEDVLLAVTPIAFDIAALELFLPLISGATVVIANRETATNPLLLAESIRHHQVTVMQATPATWQLLVDTGWQGAPGLKALCGGESLSRSLADRLLERTGELWNMYGPTETTVWSSAGQVLREKAPITIGRPIGNTQLYILDKYLEPVPVGVKGELFIGGRGVAAGYVNLERLTAEKFLPDPFSAEAGARMYMTGDNARFLPDLSIEILGRNDDQVKLNGHRIELGEITATLLEHPSVLEAMTIIRGEQNGDKRIFAYVVTGDADATGSSEWQDFIRRKLPAYMMPSAFIRLERFPLTPNGKVDRRSLPAPEDSLHPAGFVAPRNDTERVLADIWQDVLGLERIGIHDNFFDLGGASIESLAMVAKANISGLRLSVDKIFEYQTIAELAEQIRTASS